jgi:hypothetical protein
VELATTLGELRRLAVDEHSRHAERREVEAEPAQRRVGHRGEHRPPGEAVGRELVFDLQLVVLDPIPTVAVRGQVGVA